MKVFGNTHAVLVIFALLFVECTGSMPHNKVNNSTNERGEYRVMFYNTENFFDIYDDSLTQDDEFLPGGTRHWTYRRFSRKLNNIYKVVIAVGGAEAPEIIGLSEIENMYVLKRLIYDTPLSKYEYGIIHKDSDDPRGIDVALLFRKDKLELLEKRFIKVTFPQDTIKKTRDVLYFKGQAKRGQTPEKDTIHVFINHWPSRYRGQLETEPYRIYAASVLKKKTDSVFKADKNPKIIITGDFNDEPLNRSIKEVLSAGTDPDTILPEKLYNLSCCLSQITKSGTYKYKFNWEMYDQFIVSGSLLNSNKIKTSMNDVHIFNPDFLLEEDNKYSGFKPFRTYYGYKYIGGFSDHLPIILDLY